MPTISLQLEFRPEIPNVYGAVDYREFRETLIKIDKLLDKTGIEDQLVKEALDKYVDEKQVDVDKFYNSRQAGFHYKKLRYALRCNIARHLTGESYRMFSIRLADSELLQWFVSISVFSSRKAVSKSSLERYEKYFPEEMVAENICKLLSDLTKPNKALEVGLSETISCKNIFTDSTCVKANIHFPVDWVLLRDAARSLLGAIKTIRAQGLKHRMIEPPVLLRQMNKLCIAMTHQRRRNDSKKQRKKIFREMKKVSSCIAKHAMRYRKLLSKEWEKTDWTYAQTQQVIRRMDLILEQLPAAVKQAHERIIGERLVSAEDKILSLYDKDAHVIIRGKAGSEVEFGQGLLLSEQNDGLIVDWHLFADQPPHDSKVMIPALKRIVKRYGDIDSSCADRAFDTKNNNMFYQENNIYNAICPKNPRQLQDKLSEPIFISLQTRRSQTEGRIGIFKNIFLGKPLRSRITDYKRIAITWCVLTHNLWVLARMIIDAEKRMRKKTNGKMLLKIA
jgi:hypothetical protein